MTEAEGMPNSREGRFAEAAEWLTRLHDIGELSADELRAWQKFTSSPENCAALEQVERVAGSLAGIARPSLPSAAELANDHYDGSVSVREWMSTEHNRRARGEAPRQRLWNIGWRRGAIAAGVAALLVLALWIGRSVWPPSTHETFETLAAEHSVHTLKDGSTVTLGARTSIEIRLTRNRREVTLHQGEALFSVAHDKKRPFVVVAGEGSVTALGTEFNVWRGLDRVTVTVTEGAVDVASSGPQPNAGGTSARHDQRARVRKGQEVSYEEHGQLTKVAAADIAAATAWREGRLIYRHTALKYVIADVNRYFRTQLVIGDYATGELQFSGAVPQNLAAGDFVRALEAIFHLESVEIDGRIVIRTRTVQAVKRTVVKI